MLQAEGCDEAQGFLQGRPAPLDRIDMAANVGRLPEMLGSMRRAAGVAVANAERPAS